MAWSRVEFCMTLFCHTRDVKPLVYCTIAGVDPEISERGDRKPNSRKGVLECDFSVLLSVIFL